MSLISFRGQRASTDPLQTQPAPYQGPYSSIPGTHRPAPPSGPYPGPYSSIPGTHQPAPAAGGPVQAANDWTTGPWDANRVRSYFQSRNVAPQATSPDYWAGKWNEWGTKDPAYFLKRLSLADEFGGGWTGEGPPGGGAGGGPVGGPGYSDPATQQWNAYLQQARDLLTKQQQAQEQANVGLRQRQAEAGTSAKRLTDFLTQRAQKLQGPAYTGPEQQILRTQQLDPIERDRQAAHQRVLQNISARGLDPGSGIAQELMNQVDRGFDQQRAAAQGEMGYRQVAEQRSRDQEAQSLLGMIPELQRAGASGDLAFLQQLDAAINRPQEAQLPLSRFQYQIPQEAMAQALQAMGAGPQQGDLFNQAMQMYQVQQSQQQRGLPWYGSIGQALPYILGGR